MTSAMRKSEFVADGQIQRLELLLSVSRRLADAIASDIAALHGGAFDRLKTTDPEIERLCAFYAREVRALKAEGGIKGGPRELIAALKDTGARLNGLLQEHGILVGAMREAAEGLVHAVAEGVAKQRKGAAPYTEHPAPKRPAGSEAIVYNKVI